ncbi:MAG: nickel pincer cofactor biosynthesis protein LarB [Chloroflexota bacterium]
MDEAALRALLLSVSSGGVTPDDALGRIKRLDVEDLGFARIDHHRLLRRGFPEVIYSPGKTAEEVALIGERLASAGQSVLATRCSIEAYEALRARVPDAVYHARARCAVAVRNKPIVATGLVVVATGGTSDIPVAEEASLTAELAGSPVERMWDVGVAGIHRLLANRERLLAANVVIAVAGMEGALPSVIGGLVDRPVIAVPTSVGYGAAFGGLAPLLGMLNSCAPGVSVMNIDNGFGAGYLAAMINRMSDASPSGVQK